MLLMPVLEEIEAETSDTHKFVKIDVTKDLAFAASHSVMSVPVMAKFEDGKEVARLQGMNPKPKIVDWMG